MTWYSKFLPQFWQSKEDTTSTKSFTIPFYGTSSLVPVISKSTAYGLYASNPDIRTCIRKKWLTLSKEWITLQKLSDRSDVEEKQAKEAYDFMHNMMSSPTYSQFLIEIVKHLDVAGEVYFTPTKTLWTEQVNGIQILHPLSIQKRTSDGEAVKFTQSAQGQRQATFMNKKFSDIGNTLLYYKLEPHTANEYDGMGLLEWVVMDALGDQEAQLVNYMAFKNWLKVSHMIIPEEWITPEQAKVLWQQIQNTHWWSENAHKPFLWLGVKDIKTLDKSLAEMEYGLQRKLTIDKVCSALQVPRWLIGYTESVNYSNLITLYRDFIDNTINPYQDLIEYMVNDFIQEYQIPQLKDYYIKLNDVSVNDEWATKELMLKELDAGTMTINEYRVHFNKEELPQEEASMPLVSKARIRIDDVALDAILPNTNT